MGVLPGAAFSASSVQRMMQPFLDQLIQFTRTLAHDYDFVRVVLASTGGTTQGNPQGDLQFIEVTDGPDYRTELQPALRHGLTALGPAGLGAQGRQPCRPSAGCSPGTMRA